MQTSSVETGSSCFVRSEIRRFAGARVGFIGNHTSRLTDNSATVESLIKSTDVKLVRLFSPEHGAQGKYDDTVGDEIDPLTGLSISSLYGENRQPRPDQLQDLDLLIFELQDIGARFYTYLATLLLSIDAMTSAGKRVIVLDRPNPITGLYTEGPLATSISFTSPHTVPIRHGLTLGELATLYAHETNQQKSVEVIRCEGWSRNMWFDETGIEWVNPSPAMQSLTAATLYPGVCLLEQTNVSVGRGTVSPFGLVGAPWIDAAEWAKALGFIGLDGVVCTPITFKPKYSKFTEETCRGLNITVADRERFHAVDLGFALLLTLVALHPQQFEIAGIKTLLANEKVFDMIVNGDSVDDLRSYCSNDLVIWNTRRNACLLYP